MKRVFAALAAVMILSLVAAQCGAPATVVVTKEVEVEKIVIETVEVEVEKIVEVEKVVEVEKIVEVEKVVTPTPEPKLGEATEAVQGGTLTISIGNDIQNFDPVTSLIQVYRSHVQKAVFNMLYQYDENGEMVPMLAESMEQPDSKTYVFHLREGVTWHDGKPFTAQDVVYTFGRIQDPEEGSPYLPYYEGVASTEATDDHTVTVTLKEINGSFMDSIAAAPIVQDGSGESNVLNPVGTGPFKFVSWTSNDQGVFEANPDYFRGAPMVDNLIFKIQPEAQIALTNLQAGEVDAIAPFPGKLVPVVANDPNIELLVQETPTLLMFIELRADKDYTKTPKLRQALAHCINYEALKKVVFSDHGTPTSHFLHPSSPYWEDLPLYEYDPELAKQMFEEEGLPEDLSPLVIEVPTGWPELEQLAVIWQAGLTEAGITADVRVGEIQVWLERTLGPDLTVATNAYGPSPDPNTWYQIIPRRHWYGYVTDEPGDYTTPAAKEMEKLVNEALTAPDEETRAAKWLEVNRLHHEELPAIPVFYWPIFMPIRPGVHDIAISPTSDYHYQNAWVEWAE